MNVHDIPMVIFTVFSQMSVGTFITLGVVQLLAAGRRESRTVQRVVAPVLYAIGPVLVFALVVSMLHMNDVTNMFNVIRHWDSSWLSREIILGVAFAALGFLFALLEWFKAGSPALRQVIAGVTALIGVGFVIAQSQIYATLTTVPAWHSWATPMLFFGTTILLGTLAVGAALMVTHLIRQRTVPATGPAAVDDPGKDTEKPADTGGGLMLQVRTRTQEINAPTTAAEWKLTAAVLRGIAFVGAATAVALLVVYAVYFADLAQGGAAAQASLALLTGSTMWLRLTLLAVTAIILGFFVYRMAETVERGRARVLVTLVLVSLALAFTSEFLGRLLHYVAHVGVGI